MSNGVVVERDEDQNDFKITLPCKPDEFAEFISSLISKGQTLERSFDCLFELRVEDLRQFYILLGQRGLQNSGEIISFHAQMFFSGGGHVSLNSPEEFFSFNELKKSTTRNISLEFVFLIQFPNKKNPEKQTVAISISPGVQKGDESIYSYRTPAPESKISISISHTERTWANDIVNLFEDFLGNHTIQSPKLVRVWNKLSGYITGVAGFLCFGVGLLGIIFGYNFWQEGQVDSISKILEIQDKDEFIRSALNQLISGSDSTSLIYFIVGSLFYVVLLGFVSGMLSDRLGRSAVIQSRSWMLATSADIQKHGQSSVSPFRYLLLFKELFIGIFVGLIANTIFSLIWI
ncbi:hypothetical protein ESZ36_02125 [Colwellia demingiae]|uniref:Uncharacterized protein n=1 Tax=Colwellia demingiae TaxID=89401 RepID=A0A5C6QTW6_9GAMM|nr:hypothetical protein [Colwellia demingiae]TWX72051.1 hypothetical protein ESZ36_02125 [Colwellia demingiae]